MIKREELKMMSNNATLVNNTNLNQYTHTLLSKLSTTEKNWDHRENSEFVELAFSQNDGAINTAKHFELSLNLNEIIKASNEAQSKGQNVYIGIGTRKLPKANIQKLLHQRTGKEHINSIPFIFVDIDENFDLAIEKIKQSGLPFPTLVNITCDNPSRRGHLIWVLDNRHYAHQEYEEAIELLVNYLGGDPQCKDLSRLMVLPGTRKFLTESKKKNGRQDMDTYCDDQLSTYEICNFHNLRGRLLVLGNHVQVNDNKIVVGKMDPEEVLNKYFTEGNSHQPLMIITQGLMARGYTEDSASKFLEPKLKQFSKEREYMKEFHAMWKNLAKKVEEGTVVLYQEKKSILSPDRFVYVAKEDRILDRSTGEIFKLNVLDNYYKHIGKKIFSNRLMSDEKLHRVYGFACDPTQKEFFRLQGSSLYNTYREHKIPVIEGDISPFLELTKYLFPEDDHQNYFYDWLAHNIQHPGVKINYVPLIIGPQGIGKTFYYKVMEAILGEDNCMQANQDKVIGRFNNELAKCIFLACEEIHIPGSPKTQLAYMNKFKPIITEDKITIEPKGVDTYKTKNNLNMIMFSNFPEPISLEESDRRFLVLYTKALPKEEVFYKNLFEWLYDKGKSYLKYWFMQRDLSHFNPKGRAPQTHHKQYILSQSKEEIEDWIISRLESDEHPFRYPDLLCPMHLEEVIKKVDRSLNIKAKDIRSTLIKFGYFELDKQVRMKDGSRPKFYAKGKDQADYLSNLQDSKIANYYRKPKFDFVNNSFEYVSGSAIEEDDTKNEDLPF